MKASLILSLFLSSLSAASPLQASAEGLQMRQDEVEVQGKKPFYFKPKRHSALYNRKACMITFPSAPGSPGHQEICLGTEQYCKSGERVWRRASLDEHYEDEQDCFNKHEASPGPQPEKEPFFLPVEITSTEWKKNWCGSEYWRDAEDCIGTTAWCKGHGVELKYFKNEQECLASREDQGSNEIDGQPAN
ncbi:hypothetical protein CDD83_3745 [Cordyceps sp. RAO-2017]|nr:hypothetical protein CDD83_3745 [Cordyceps sp. RAO-2017]